MLHLLKLVSSLKLLNQFEANLAVMLHGWPSTYVVEIHMPYHYSLTWDPTEMLNNLHLRNYDHFMFKCQLDITIT